MLDIYTIVGYTISYNGSAPLTLVKYACISTYMACIKVSQLFLKAVEYVGIDLVVGDNNNFFYNVLLDYYCYKIFMG